MKKKSTLKIYYQDFIETVLSNIILLFIISLIIVFLQLPFFLFAIHLFVICFVALYFKREIVFFFKIRKDILSNNISEKVVVFDKIETDLVYGRQKRREFFKRYITPRYLFYNDKDLYRIGMNYDANVYSFIRGKEFNVKYLKNTKFIISIKPMFELSENEKNNLIKMFGNVE